LNLLLTDKAVQIRYFCPETKQIVLLTIKGSVYAGLINGTVQACDLLPCCPKRDRSQCVLTKRIQTKLGAENV
jgi:hypothetical protein